MKSEIHGKRFSKIKTNTITSDDSLDEVHKFLRNITSQPSTVWRTFDNIILYWSERAPIILKENHLPGNALLYLVDKNEQWQSERPTSYTSLKETFLSHYVIKELGYNKDSLVGLTARILTIIEQLKTAKNKDALMLAYEFGEAITLLNVYSIESNQNKKNSGKSRKKQWAVKLAEHLVNENPNLKFPEYWGMIPENEELLHCYRDDNDAYLKYDKHGEKKEQITYEHIAEAIQYRYQ